MPKKPNKSYKHINRFDWKKVKDWKYPYRDYGLYGCLKDPKYIKNKNDLFKLNGNGWWINDGKGWDPDKLTPMQRARKYKKRKET